MRARRSRFIVSHISRSIEMWATQRYWPELGHLPQRIQFPRYGTANGRTPSIGKIPVGVVAVEGCERNM
jgi:hypothetical protein